MRFAVLMLLVLAACDPAVVPIDAGTDAGRVYVPESFTPTEATRAYCPGDDDAVEARITAALAELSVREKVALIHGASVALVDGSWRVEGNARLGLPGLRMLDGPRGVSRFSNLNGTAFPVAAMRGATFDPELEREVGAAMAREIRAARADVLLAPTINVLRHPRWGRAQETYSEDVHHLGEMGVAFIEGVQAEGVIASAKHFAANSIEDTRHEVDVVIDERTLREIYLPHFRRAVVEARVGSVMSAYNQINGAFADMSAHLLRDILKDEWSFAGFVESDWILGTHADADSVRAGLDIEMPFDTHFRRLPGAIEEGRLTERELDDSVRRVLRAQLCYGLDEREVIDDPSARETPAHLALAREVATRGIVLLENDGALPLASDVGEVVLLGRLADVANIGDDGSSAVAPTHVVTAREGLAARLGDRLAYVETLDATAEAAITTADAVIVVTGLLADDEGEGEIGAGDRASLTLPPEEIELIRAVAALHANVIMVLEGGSAIVVSEWVDEIEALLMAFYPGSEGGHAIGDVLFGDAAPSGRLPFSVPEREEDLPPFDNTSLEVTYGYLHGYRYLADAGTTPRYAFGYGLSYTSFAYGSLTLSAATIPTDGALTVDVDVTNTGDRAGRETVQLYVSARGSRVSRAPSDLRAFGQVELAPGATETVRLSLSAEDLAFRDVDAGAFEVEAIQYEVQVGASATDTRQRATFRVE